MDWHSRRTDIREWVLLGVLAVQQPCRAGHGYRAGHDCFEHQRRMGKTAAGFWRWDRFCFTCQHKRHAERIGGLAGGLELLAALDNRPVSRV